MKDTAIKPEYITKLLKFVEEKKVTERTAELMLRDMVTNPKDPEKLIIGKARIFDEKLLEPLVKEVLNENPQAIIDYKSGKSETFNFLVGQVMRKTQGRGDPDTIRKLLRGRLQ